MSRKKVQEYRNILYLLGNKDDILDVLSNISSKDREFDMDIIDPMPDDIKKTTEFASANSAFLAVYDYEYTGIFSYMSQYMSGYDNEADCVNGIKRKIGYTKERAELLINNKAKYDAHNWNEWHKKHWDTKYNTKQCKTYDIMSIDDSLSVDSISILSDIITDNFSGNNDTNIKKIEFTTNGYEVSKYVEKLSFMFKDVAFVYSYNNKKDCGHYIQYETLFKCYYIKEKIIIYYSYDN